MYKVRMTLSSAIDGGADQTSKRRCLTPYTRGYKCFESNFRPLLYLR